jgi:hypothetical protein
MCAWTVLKYESRYITGQFVCISFSIYIVKKISNKYNPSVSLHGMYFVT